MIRAIVSIVLGGYMTELIRIKSLRVIGVLEVFGVGYVIE